MKAIQKMGMAELRCTARANGLKFRVGTKAEEIRAGLLALPSIKEPPAKESKPKQAPKPKELAGDATQEQIEAAKKLLRKAGFAIDAEAETIREPIKPAVEDEDWIDDFYETLHAEPDTQYYLINPAAEICSRRNPITMQWAMLNLFRPVNIKVPDGKMLRIVYPPGHYEHPIGATEIVPAKWIVVSRPRRFQDKAERERFLRDNPGFNPEMAGENMAYGPNGTITLDTKRRVRPGYEDEAMTSESHNRALADSIRRGRQRLEDLPNSEEFFDKLQSAAEEKSIVDILGA